MDAVSTGWEDRAAGWIAWARKPSHDAYRHFRDAFFALLPPPGGRALEVGCGEGRVCRDLRARGYDVVGLDAAPTLVAAAAAADSEGSYVVGTAEALPFPDGSLDLVLAYNSLMDVADMPLAVAEAARVLAPGGRFCACVVHPVAEAGTWTSREPDASFVIRGSYFEERHYEETFERDGLTFTFRSRSYPLRSYGAALERAGFLVEALREPDPARGSPGEDRYSRVPLFLLWRALRP
jgi:SAM-dependent methyltransferase